MRVLVAEDDKRIAQSLSVALAVRDRAIGKR